MIDLAKPLVRGLLVAIAVALIAALLGLSSCQRERTAATKARLGQGLSNAAIASGGDAVDTVGNRAASDAAIDAVTRENDVAIRTAPGADVKVSDEADTAGRRALCRRATYRETPQCAAYR